MDWGTATVGIITLGLCILPFYAAKRNREGREKKLVRSLETIARENKCTLTEQELSRDFALGLDRNKKYLFFILNRPDQRLSVATDLNRVSGCRVERKTHSVTIEKERHEVLEALLLTLTFKDGAEDLSLELFNWQVSLQPTGEPETAKVWADKVKNLLTA